jgi:hypothetical protein
MAFRILLALLLFQTAEPQKPKDPFATFHWLTTGGENRGVVYKTSSIPALVLDPSADAPREIQAEVTRPDANTMRIVRRAYNTDANGRVQVIEIVTEDVRATAGGGFSAARSISRLDANGRMQSVEKQTQETVRAGADTYRTQTTIARGTGSLVPSEQVTQVERKKADGIVEIERTDQLAGVSGGWRTAERRVSSLRETDKRVAAQEEVYRPDINGRLALLRRDVSGQSQDSQGSDTRTIETYLADATGKLQLNGRTTIVNVTYGDGSQQATQTTVQVNSANPSAALTLSEKVVQTVRPAGAETVEKEIQVQKPDVNGALQTLSYQKVTERR